VTALLITLVYLTIVAGVGRGVARFLRLDSALPFAAERLAVAFGIGSVWLTSWIFWCGLAGFPFSRVTAAVGCFPLLLGWRRRTRRATAPADPGSVLDRSWIRVGLGVLVAVAVLRAAAVSFADPVHGWDAVSNWQLKARAFYEDQGIGLLMRSDTHHVNYPLHVPLSSALYYFFRGTVDDFLVQALSYAWYLSILAVSFGGVRRVAGRGAALLAVAVLGAAPALVSEFSKTQADGPLAFLFLVAGLSLLRYSVTANPAELRLTGIFLYGCMWTKNEGMIQALAGVAIGAALAVRRGRLRDVAGLAPVLLIIPWLLVVTTLPAQKHQLSSLLGGGVLAALQRVPVVALRLAEEALHPRWLFVWPVLLLLIGMSRRAMIRSWPVVLLTGVTLLTYLGVYVVTDQDYLWLVQTSLPRLLLHLMPTSVVLVAYLIAAARGLRPGWAGPIGTARVLASPAPDSLQSRRR
jgi:hypothetical protein